ncbi:MAG: hypothetical protein QXT87_01945 [Thermoproteota archaeon]
MKEKAMAISATRLERPLESRPVKTSHNDSKKCFIAMPINSTMAKDNILSILLIILHHAYG